MKTRFNIQNIDKIKGEINIPPSKSYTHRLMIACALSCYKSNVAVLFYHPLICIDTLCTLLGLRSLGFDITYDSINDSIICNGFKYQDDYPMIDAEESASTLRFLIPLSIILYPKVCFTGAKSLFDRGIDGYYDFFRINNISYEITNTTLILTNNNKNNLKIEDIDGSKSSQYLTGLLFILPLLKEDHEIKISNLVSKGYFDITLDVLSNAFIKYELTTNGIKVFGNQQYILNPISVEGDYSSAGIFFGLQYEYKNIIIKGLSEISFQPDVKVKEYLNQIYYHQNTTIDIDNNIDLGPILMAFAAKYNDTTFVNINRLKIKESNRIDEMIKIFNKLNIDYELKDNQIKVYKTSELVKECEFETNDHRITQALILILLLTQTTGIIMNSNNLKKSYEELLPALMFLGFSITLI